MQRWITPAVIGEGSGPVRDAADWSSTTHPTTRGGGYWSLGYQASCSSKPRPDSQSGAAVTKAARRAAAGTASRGAGSRATRRAEAGAAASCWGSHFLQDISTKWAAREQLRQTANLLSSKHRLRSGKVSEARSILPARSSAGAAASSDPGKGDAAAA